MAKKKEKLTPVPLRRPNRNHAIGTAKPTLPPPGPDLSHIAEKLRPLAVPTSSLAFLADNPLDHDEAEIEEMRAALHRYGQLVPLIVNKRTTPPTVAGGNKRLKAALAENWQHIAVVEVDLPEDEAAALAVTLNATQGVNWNNDLLSKAMARMGKLDLGERMAGMMERLREARGLLGGVNGTNDAEDPGPQIDRAAELAKKWKTASGQLWVIPSKSVPGKSHRVLCGDSTKAEDVERVMGGELAGLIVTSPPYNQGLDQFRASGMHKENRWADNAREGSYPDSRPEEAYQEEQVLAIKLWATILTAIGSMFYNHKNRYRDKVVVSPWKWLADSGAKVRQEIIWKREGSVTQNARMFMPCDERVFWLYFGKDFYFDDSTEHKTWSSVWEINSHKDREQSMHGCAFPTELASRPIRACLKPGEVVFEPYTGSGTTIVAAEQLGRLCYGIELEPKYVAVILERLAGLGLEPRLES